jgi:general secretion pathway protein A
MYLAHYGLTTKPFELIPDPDFIHFTAQHKLAFSLLQYAIFEQTGLAVISGEIGSGKTTLIKKLITSCEDDSLVIGLIDNTHESWGDLISWVASAFDIQLESNTRANQYKEIKSFLIKQYAHKKRVILIVDEAQNMGVKTLEELRLLTNINSGKYFLLQVILVGQPELTVTLSQPELVQLAQRVSVEYHLTALNETETKTYIHHRMEKAGAISDVFNEGAIEKIYSYARGVPRLINIICDNALVYGYAKNETTITDSVIADVVKNRRIVGFKN